jgi:hypothetical protein
MLNHETFKELAMKMHRTVLVVAGVLAVMSALSGPWISAIAQVPKPDIAAAVKAERAKLLGSVPLSKLGEYEAKPDEQGDYVYEAGSAKVLLTDGDFKIENDWNVKGLTVATIPQVFVPLGVRPNLGLFWKLGEIAPGKYFVGVLYRCDDGKVEAPATFNAVYLNGRVIQCSTLSDPVQIAPGVWLAELQAAAAESLKGGDEIAIIPPANAPLTAVRLVLHAKEPLRGAHRTFTNYGQQYHWPATALRINAHCEFVNSKGQAIPLDSGGWGEQQLAKSPDDFLRDSSGKAVALCRIANPLPVPVTVDYECVLRSYYLKVVGKDSGKITLQPHERITRKVAFDILWDEPAYSMHATVHAVNPPDLGYPEADTVSLFPGLRQSIPWPDSFNHAYHRRVYFLDPAKTSHQVCLLSGQWEMGLTTDLNPPMPAPADIKFIPQGVPLGYLFTINMTPRPRGAYLRRTFEAPADMAGGSCRLVIKDVSDEATAYVNGKKVGNVRGESAPLIADLAGVLKPGKNEIVIVLRDLLAIMDPAYVNPKNPVYSRLYSDAPGCEGESALRMDEISLEVSPAISSEDVLVMPSYRKKSLASRINVVNHSPKATDVVVKAVVNDGDKDVFDLGQKGLSLETGKAEEVTFDKPWPDAHLYGPQDPFMYVLRVTVTDKETGKTLDVSRDRFGFRESWIEGASVYYNGHVAKFKGITGAVVLGVESDFQINRGAMMPDYMDEIGLPASESISGVYNQPSDHNVKRDIYWETAETNMIACLKRCMNHPCIVAWDLSNEWYCFLPYAGSDMKAGARRFEHMSETLLKHDPTRWTFFNGDGDLGGLHNSYCGHYITWAVQPPMCGYNLQGHSTYLPDGGFYRPLDGDFKPGQKIRFSPFYDDDFFINYGQKVFMNTENLWKVGSLMPPGFTRLLGDEDVLSPAMDCSGPSVWFWKNNLDGHRDAGTTSVSSYAVLGASHRGYVLQEFILPEVIHHGFSSRTMNMKYDVLNDVYTPADMTFKWSLTGPDGKAVAGDSRDYKMAPCDLKRDSLSFKLPDVDKRTTFVFDTRLETGGKLVYGEQRDIEVWPDKPSAAAPKAGLNATLSVGPTGPRGLGGPKTVNAAKNIFLFDPKGKTAETFKAAGIVFDTVASLNVLEKMDHARLEMLIVVGEGALDETNASAVARLDGLAAEGASVLILAQTTSPVGLPAATRIDSREWYSQTFVRMATHPILEGITSWDLHFWGPDRVVARGAYNKPDGGPALTLIDSGTDIGLEWVEMMEFFRGKGRYIICQLPLIGSFNDEPMARELLGRTLNYLGGNEPFLAPTGKLQVVAKADGLIHNALRQAGASFDLVKPDAVFDGKSVVLVDATTRPTDEQATAWAKAIGEGATVVVAGATPGDEAWLTRLAGKQVTITVPKYDMWMGRGYRVGFDKLTAGISHCDIYYKRYETVESASFQAEEPALTIEPLQDYAVSATDARELVYPGAMLSIEASKGKLVIDQRRWMSDNERLGKYARRQLTSLLLGLGVQIAPIAAPRELPKDVTYKPLDLTAFANRTLYDDVADDGKGGWSDQGPSADMRTFPTGKQFFQGVPFVIDKEKSCIVLANISTSKPGSDKMPREVTIPIGYKAQGFYFLHSAAYAGPGLTGLYQIQYADGSTFDVPLRTGENIYDWTVPPGLFLREKGTTSNFAWTGKCPMFPTISVFRMLWVNPRPDQPVKAVRFSNPAGEAVPILVAITAALANGQSADAPKNLVEIRDLLTQAARLATDKKDKEALEVVKKAVAIDPTFTTSQQALLDLYEKAGDEDIVLEAYKAWVQAGATTPLPYNRIAQILETRKDFKGALDFYTRSLKVEWNQPPIIEARKRLETVVAGGK